MKTIVEKACSLWGFDGHSVELIAARENQVFKVEGAGGKCVLRLHRKGYRSNAELRSELLVMAAIGSAGLLVPTPIASLDGNTLHTINDVQVDVLTWLDGSPMGQSNQPLDLPDRIGLFRALGVAMAQMHNATDAWQNPQEFVRPKWDREGLVGNNPLWGRFWENPTLTTPQRELFSLVRENLDGRLNVIERDLDYGLIHADLVRENVMVDGNNIGFIDFDDGGYGFRLFDIATTLAKTIGEPDYPALRDALFDGYQSVRSINLEYLDMFLLLRALTYVGWIVPRLHEDDSHARNQRFITTAEELVERHLAS